MAACLPLPPHTSPPPLTQKRLTKPQIWETDLSWTSCLLAGWPCNKAFSFLKSQCCTIGFSVHWASSPWPDNNFLSPQNQEDLESSHLPIPLSGPLVSVVLHKYIYMIGGDTENAKELSSLVSLFFPPLVTGTGRRKFRGPAESTPACDAKLLGAAQKPESFTERLDTQNGQRKGGFRWLSRWKHPNRRGHMFKCTCSDSEPASRL